MHHKNVLSSYDGISSLCLAVTAEDIKRYLNIFLCNRVSSSRPQLSVCSAHVQTVTSVLLLVGRPLCLGSVRGEWP